MAVNVVQLHLECFVIDFISSSVRFCSALFRSVHQTEFHSKKKKKYIYTEPTTLRWSISITIDVIFTKSKNNNNHNSTSKKFESIRKRKITFDWYHWVGNLTWIVCQRLVPSFHAFFHRNCVLCLFTLSNVWLCFFCLNFSWYVDVCVCFVLLLLPSLCAFFLVGRFVFCIDIFYRIYFGSSSDAQKWDEFYGLADSLNRIIGKSQDEKEKQTHTHAPATLERRANAEMFMLVWNMIYIIWNNRMIQSIKIAMNLSHLVDAIYLFNQFFKPVILNRIVYWIQ